MMFAIKSIKSGYKADKTNPILALVLIYEKMISLKEIFTIVEKNQIKINSQAFILYDLINTYLLLNYL